jgi:hypothetical protein
VIITNMIDTEDSIGNGYDSMSEDQVQEQKKHTAKKIEEEIADSLLLLNEKLLRKNPNDVCASRASRSYHYVLFVGVLYWRSLSR